MYIYKPHSNHKPKIYNYNRYTQERKEPKHNTKESYQITREESKRKRKKKKRIAKTNGK